MIADRFGTWLRRLCVALPLLILAANLLAWLRWGFDLPFLDDWRAYNTRNALSLAPAHLFVAANSTISPVGIFLDVMAQRWLGGNPLPYQALSMLAVLGGLLWLQWRLLAWALRARPWLAPACFLLTIFMLQPGSYWGAQNLAYQQALPLVALLAAAWCNFAARARLPGRPAWVTLLGLLAGLSYVSGAVAALVMGAGWLLLARLARAHGAGAIRARARSGGAALLLPGLLTTILQVVLTRRPGADPAGQSVVLTWPTQGDFWWYIAGKLGRASGLGFSALGIEVAWVVFLALAMLGAGWLTLRYLLGAARASAKRTAWLFLPLAAAVLAYLILVGLARAGYHDPGIFGPAAMFRFGYQRFHFFWLTLLLPWVAAVWSLALQRRRQRRSGYCSQRRSMALYAGLILVTLGLAGARGVFDIAGFYKNEARYRAQELRCMNRQLSAGHTVACSGFNAMGISDWRGIYGYAQEIGASFVRYLAPVAREDWSTALFDWDDPEQRRAVQGFNVQPQADGWWQADADPQFIIPLAPGASCTALNVQMKLILEHPDAMQLFYQTAGQTGYTESSSLITPVAPDAAGQVWVEFVVEDERGFEPQVRLDPMLDAGRLRVLGASVTCRPCADGAVRR
jgi:hypothetical protein